MKGQSEFNSNSGNLRPLSSFIKELIIKRGLTVNDVAGKLAVTEEKLYQLLAINSLDFNLIISLSELLDYNLFLYYLDNEVIIDLFKSHINDLNPQIINLVSQLEIKNDQIAQLKGVIETQRKAIELLEVSKVLISK